MKRLEMKRDIPEEGTAFVPPRWGLNHTLILCSRGCAPSGHLTPGCIPSPLRGWGERDLNTLRPVNGPRHTQKTAPTGRQIIARGFIPWYNGIKNILAPTGRHKNELKRIETEYNGEK